MRHLVIWFLLLTRCLAQDSQQKTLLMALPTINCPTPKSANAQILKSKNNFVNLAAATAFVVDAINEARCENFDPFARFQLTTADLDFQTLVDTDGTLEVLFIGGLAGELDKQVTSDSDFTYSVPTPVGAKPLAHEQVLSLLSNTKTKATPAKTLGEALATAMRQMAAGIGHLPALSQHQVKVSIKFAFTKDGTLELEPKIGSVGITAKFKRTDTATQTLTLTFADQAPVISLSASPSSPIARGVSITFIVSVAPPSNSTTAPAGNITFLDANAVLDTQPIRNGFAMLTIPSLAPGAHSITAVYGGDEHFDSVVSSATVLVVN